MKVKVDRARCDGLGICEGLAPQVFEINDAGELELLLEDVSGALLPEVEDAVTSCPMEALSLAPNNVPIVEGP